MCICLNVFVLNMQRDGNVFGRGAVQNRDHPLDIADDRSAASIRDSFFDIQYRRTGQYNMKWTRNWPDYSASIKKGPTLQQGPLKLKFQQTSIRELIP